MRIKLNGREISTKMTNTRSLAEKAGTEASVVIVNGYAVSENYNIEQGDEVFLIQKGVMPGRQEFEAMLSARHTPKVYEKVKVGKVAIAGLGGLGSHIAMMLAQTGVGELLLIDFDVVEPSNLNRQHYSIEHLGRRKTECMREQIEKVNPFIKVKTEDLFLTRDNAVPILQKYPLICEAFDNPKSKAMLVNTILESCPKSIVIAASGMAGFDSANRIHTRRSMRRLYVCGDEEGEAAFGRGLMAPRVQVCAGHQANMVLRLLLGEEEE